jgi:hypothetical protein
MATIGERSMSEILAEIKKAKPKQPTDHQQNERMMARWTRMVGAFTVVLAAVAAVSAIILYRQLQAMRGQLEEMRNAGRQTDEIVAANKALAQSAVNQGSIMLGQLKEMREQSIATRAQIRARLTLTIVPNDMRAQNAWVFTPVWVNHGTTEALDFNGWVSAYSFIPDAPADFNFLEPISKPEPGVHSTVEPQGVRMQGSVGVLDDNITRTMAGTEMTYLWLYMEYRDIFEKEHHENWCFKLVPLKVGDNLQFSFPLANPKCVRTD